MSLKEYIAELDRQYRSGQAGEHAYRPALKTLLEELLPTLLVTNEPTRVACGAPDMLLSDRRTGRPAAYVECKDVDDSDLAGRAQHKEQFNRYKSSLSRVLFTDYLDFHLYIEGQLVQCVRVATLQGERIRAVPQSEEQFLTMLAQATQGGLEPIRTPAQLAHIMAAKARLLAVTVQKALQESQQEEQQAYANLYLHNTYQAFREELIHDLTPEAFADLYAQTITYGLFAARLYDTTPEDFSRLEAAQLIPKTNPFLRRVFQDIAGYDLDPRIAWIIDDLVQAFALTRMDEIMAGYADRTGRHDPLVHFYEDFLAAYNPALRKARGVWYTPAPVVGFIVRAVDSILQTHFGLAQGLSDASEVARAEGQVPRVQLLDPAAGTGTFLAEVVYQIHEQFQQHPDLWSSYAQAHLLNRLYGFELLMASYAIAHVKLNLLLASTGFKPLDGQRINVFLTNALEPPAPTKASLFAPWLSAESRAADALKRKGPVMVMLGNPPYSVSSSNKGKWITELLNDYKRNLNERNLQPLSDDYIKFIRLGQYYIERTGEGILAFITNNSFLDGLIHRQMRLELLRAFDAIYILDLHGNARKQESAPGGGKDENVFDIMQGVSINIFVKTAKKPTEALATLHYHELWGRRDDKYQWLDQHAFTSVPWTTLTPQQPMYYFVPKDLSLEQEYREQCFGVTELFHEGSTGITTSNDSLLVCPTVARAQALLADIRTLPVEEFRTKWPAGPDKRDWSVGRAKADAIENAARIEIVPFAYRVFDNRFLVYSETTNGLLGRPRGQVMRHMLRENVALLATRTNRGLSDRYAWCVEAAVDRHYLDSSADSMCLFPLYLYNADGSRMPNLEVAIVARLSERVGCELVPEEVFDYVYGTLHSSTYRARYAELLKGDFPRIPYPGDAQAFEEVRELGHTLRELHLMHGAEGWQLENHFVGQGDLCVDRPHFVDQRVYINATQYFEGVSPEVWDFYVGGYQPAQKWLKDRQHRQLAFSDVLHYRRILYVLARTVSLLGRRD